MSDPADNITFEFNRRTIPTRPGDTVASALYRSGQRIFARSFKYHRPRGLLCLNGKCPNCLMNIDGVPNVRTCVTPVRAGMRVRHQNANPSLERDWLSVVQRFDWLMPVGWYYKALTNPNMWHRAEPWIRKVAGLGSPPVLDGDPPDYEHGFLQAEVAVIGAGPSGLQAALQHASRGKQVVLVDDQPAPGGHLRYSKDGPGRVRDIAAQLQSLSNVQPLQGSYCFGLYEGNLLGVLHPDPHPGVRERLIHLRAAHVVVATGAYEVPVLFRNNDLVGIMLSSAVQKLIRLHGIKPGNRAVVVAGNPRGEQIASELREAGISVQALVSPQQVTGANGNSHVRVLKTVGKDIECDLVVVCGHRVPDAGLLAQAGGRLQWDDASNAFIPVDLPAHVSAVGQVTGEGLAPGSPLPEEALPGKREFVCLCSDVTTNDLRDAIAEGFDHIETLKRYTTATMGPCQGRMCQLTTIAVCARGTNRSMGETGTTTARPPNPSVTLGALAGARHHPIRRTPMHYWHDAAGAVWMDMGEWKRPRFYRTAQSSEERRCIEEEYRAVRERAGIIDVSTLGKLDLKGRDTGKLLDLVYTDRFSNLKPGRVRYAVICDEAGTILDDGTISRLNENHWFITTTTGNLEFVQQWLEWWLLGTGWDVQITNVTGGMAALNLAGPSARDVLRQLTDCDLSAKAFSYMACREATVAGVPVVLLRIGFVGETGWEIHFPAEFGEHVWTALVTAGKPVDLRPFGVEAQRLLRLEKRHVIVGVDTDALTNPLDADMAWVAKLDKQDFIGKAALSWLEPGNQRLVGFIMNENGLPEDGAAVVVDGKLAGRVTSTRYSPRVGKAIGLAWVPTEKASEGARIQVRVDGHLADAQVTQQPFYDPEGARLRM